MEEGIRFARGEITLRVTVLPEPPPPLRAGDIRRLSLSQRVFARALNVSAKTVQSWEQGQSRPSQAALRLLQVVAAKPEVLGEVVGLATAAGAKPRGRGRGR